MECLIFGTINHNFAKWISVAALLGSAITFQGLLAWTSPNNTHWLTQNASHSHANSSLPPSRGATLLTSFVGWYFQYFIAYYQDARCVYVRGIVRGSVRHFSAHFCRRCELFGTCPRYNRVTVRRQWPRPLGTHRWLQLCEFSTSAPPPSQRHSCYYAIVRVYRCHYNAIRSMPLMRGYKSLWKSVTLACTWALRTDNN